MAGPDHHSALGEDLEFVCVDGGQPGLAGITFTLNWAPATGNTRAEDGCVCAAEQRLVPLDAGNDSVGGAPKQILGHSFDTQTRFIEVVAG